MTRQGRGHKGAGRAARPERAPDPGATLLWGAHSVLSDDVLSYEDMVNRAKAATLDEAFAEKGQRIVIVAGIPFGKAGSTNNLRVALL